VPATIRNFRQAQGLIAIGLVALSLSQIVPVAESVPLKKTRKEIPCGFDDSGRILVI